MFKDLVKYTLMLLLCAVVLSCDNDNNGSTVAMPLRNVVFTIALDEQIATRATWGDSYPSTEANSFECRILPNELRVAVYTVAGEKIGEVQSLSYWPINETHTEYRFMGAMPQEFMEHFASLGDEESHEYKLMVFANCPVGDDATLVYNYTVLNVNDGALPMWGVKKVDFTPLKNIENQDVGTISLLRAAAKIEVELAAAFKEDYNVSLDSVYINYFNQTGYCAPENWNSVNNTEELDTESFRLFRHAAVHMPFFKNEETGNFFVYVPEYNNIDYPEEKAQITIEFTQDGKRRIVKDAISFCEYNNGTAVEGSDYNIVRNHLYKYRIRSIAGEQLLLEYSVADWEAEDWGDGATYEEHDMTYPTYLNPVMPAAYFDWTGQEGEVYEIKQVPEMYWHNGDETGAFVCYFKIMAPDNVKWKPVFMNSTSDYRIKVYKASGESNNKASGDILYNECVYDTGALSKYEELGPCGVYEWFKIVVFPIDGSTVGDAVDLGIVYNQSWTDSYINLYINGEYGNIKWPSSGDNPKLINIKHVSSASTN